MSLVFCGFPGTGKSTITKNAEKYGLKHCHVHKDNNGEIEITVPAGELTPVFDSDSSLFDKEHFPGNYIKHIQGILNQYPNAVILMSSHDTVREALKDAGIVYTLVYPQRELKEEYLERYEQRGSPEAFVKMMDNKWNDFIDTCVQDEAAADHIVLSEGEYLVDQIKDTISTAIDYDKPLLDQYAGAQIHGTESIGDVVTDVNGNPVACWGHNGLEPLKTPPASIVNPDGAVTINTTDGPEVTVDPEHGNVNIVSKDDGVSAGVDEVIVQAENGVIVNVDKQDGTVTTTEILTPPDEPELRITPEAAQVTDAIIETVDAQPPTDQQLDTSNVPAPAVLPDNTLDAPTVDVTPGTPENVQVDVVPEVTPVVEAQIVPVTVDGQEAIDQPVDGGENLEAQTPEEEAETHDRADLLEAHFDMQNDLDVMGIVVDRCKDPEQRAGMENMEDGGAILTAAVVDIKERYGVDVEPTLAGMEGFLDSIKAAFTAIGEKIKGQPNKEQLAKVKKYLFEAEKAFLIYGTDKWINSQKLINVGKVKLQVPSILKDVNSVSDVDSILKLINERVMKAFKNHDSNAGARCRAGLKVFNQFKNKPEDTDIGELGKALPISPEKIKTGGVADAGLNDLDTKFVTGEFPVLNAAGIKEMSKVVERVIDVSFFMLKAMEGYEDKTLVDSDFWDSDFLDKHLESDSVDAVMACTIYERVTDQLQDIDYMYGQKLLNVCKFLEMWILNSVK